MTIPIVNVVPPNKNCDKYVIDFTVDGKRRRRRVGRNKKNAHLIAAKIQHELTLGPFDLLAEDKLVIDIQTLIDKYFLYLKIRVKSSTINRYQNHLTPFSIFMAGRFKDVVNDLRLIKSLYIEEYIVYLVNEVEWARYTVNRSLQTLSSLFIFAINSEYLEKNPCIGVKKLSIPDKEFPEYFKEEEL